MAGRKQRGRGGGRGYRGDKGFGRGGGRGGGGGGGSARGRGRGRGASYAMTDDIDDEYVVRTSGPPFWLISFMVRALQSPGLLVARCAVSERKGAETRGKRTRVRL